jgi:hypothetical protein
MRVIRHRLRQLHREERGSVMFFFIGFLPVAIAIAALVIDVANGYEHRRHLQLQADAGVLAAAQAFNGCFLDPTAASADIEAQALAYSGETHNAQIGSAEAQSRVVPRINASSWTADSYSDGDPCETGFVDLKLIEGDSPAFFPFVDSSDYNAHARVQVFTLRDSSRMLPIAVPDPDPQSARATFVDETTGAVLATTTLNHNGSTDGLSIWDNSTAAVSVPITAEHVGVRIALSGGTSTTCGDPFVTCYDEGSGHGLVHIRGWTSTGVGAAKTPLARAVSLFPAASGGCPDAYFTGATVPCAIGAQATVDFGVANPVITLGATVNATVDGTPFPMAYDAVSQTWTTTGSVTLQPGSGPHDVGLRWEIARNADGTRCNGGTCRGDLDALQRTFSATSDRSGPIALAQVTESSPTPAPDAHVFERCIGVATPACTKSLVVKIGLLGGLELSRTGDAPVRLRVIGGSENQSLDCDPNKPNLKTELATGCSPSYTPHLDTSDPCPNSPSALPQPNPPAVWDCVAVQTGNATNQVAQGLNERILGAANATSCTSPNHWPNYRDYPGDPRIVLVIVTPFGAFTGSGSTTVPVVRFAAFYITGWTGQGGGVNPCLGNGDETPNNAAEIVGRFINYVETPNEGGAGEESCDFTALDPCVAVLVE